MKLMIAMFVLPVIAAQVAGTRLARAWDGAKFTKPGEAALRQMLTPLQYKVTQQDGTEPAFHNEYWDNHAPGIYVDVVSGEPLFSSLDKFDSGTGWPSFTKPLDPGNIRTRVDRRLFSERTEVRSAHADSHLGHVFDDGPRAYGPALLHELRRAALHPGGEAGGRRLRRVSAAL